MVLVCVGDSGDGNSESRSVLSGFTCFCQDKCQPIVVASMVARVGPLAKADPRVVPSFNAGNPSRHKAPTDAVNIEYSWCCQTFEQWKNPWGSGYIGDYTTQLRGDYNKPW